jgi:hypothetical protein
MDNSTVFKLIIALSIIVAVGVVSYAVVERISEKALHFALGGLGVLTVMLSVGGLFIAKDVIQAYLMQRTVAQDDMNDLKQMAMLSQMMGKQNINVKMPKQKDQQQLPSWVVLPGQGQDHGQRGQVFDGQFRDTTANEGVELE